MTALAEALRSAGVVPARERLTEITVAAFKANPKWDGARDIVFNAVRNDAALLWALFEPYRAVAVQKLLTDVAQQMRADEMARQRAGKRMAAAAEVPPAAATTRSEPRKVPLRVASTNERDRGGHVWGENQAAFAPSRSGMDAVARVVRQSLLDTFQINGRPIGDCAVSEVRAWAERRQKDARTAGRDARFAMALVANLPGGEVIRSWWKDPDEVERIFKRAEAEQDDQSALKEAEHAA